MYTCEICDTYLLKRNKTKHEQSKKHKYFYSNLILNRYIIKNVEVNKFKDVFNPYFIAHTRKFNFFTISISLRLYYEGHLIGHKITVSNYVTYSIKSEHYFTIATESASDFLHRITGIYFYHRSNFKMIDEIEIIFTSDPKYITRQHYLEQPKSMLCRKLIRRFHESTSQDFEYKWLPLSFKNL